MNRGKKRKGRPPKNKVLISEDAPDKPSIADSTPLSRRSGRRNPSQSQLHSEDDYEFEDDDDERMEKKVKLVVRLPNESEEKANEKVRNLGSEDAGVIKKMRISGSEEDLLDQETKFAEAAADASLRGSRLESNSTTPLPDRKLLIFILDRLQKKDTYGVFAKPVDPEELPDYFEVIEKPMDFETVRKKLSSGAYSNLEELEADVFLICSNAMQYNSPDTIYYRQARTIQDLAKRDFENLKHEGEDGEPQPKVVRRGRPPSNKNKNKIAEEKPIESSSVAAAADRMGPELSSGAADDKATEAGAYNLRKASTPYKFQLADPFTSSSRSRFGENHTEWTSDWSDFPAHILRADMKYGKKKFTVDENRRDTYRPLNPPSSGSNSAVPSNNVGDLRRLVPIGLQDPLAYARSLARFAANLGPTAWKIASKKIECVLPPGMKYGPGWVGESPTADAQPYSFSAEKKISPSNIIATPPTCDSISAKTHDKVVGGVRGMNHRMDGVGKGRDPSSWRSQLLAHQQNLMNQSHPYNNGFSPMLGHNSSSLSIPSNPRMPFQGHSASGLCVPQMVGNKPMKEEAEDVPKLQEYAPLASQAGEGSTTADIADSHGGEVGARNLGNAVWKSSPTQQMRNDNVAPPPDLNVRIPASSPSSSGLQIGSPPQQPDLALQL